MNMHSDCLINMLVKFRLSVIEYWPLRGWSVLLQYFRTLNTRVSVVYIETWQGTNQASIDRTQDVSRALMNFNDYTSRKLFKVDKDTTQLLT